MRLPSEGKDFVIAPPGTHLGMCIQVIQTGSHKSTFQGKVSMKPKLRIVWELPDEKMDDGRPLIQAQNYTWSLNKKSKLRADLESWRGRPFNAEDINGDFQLENVLGKPCLLTVVHNENDGNTYANVSGVAKVMKGQKVPASTVNEQLCLILYEGREAFKEDAFKKLSQKMQAFIAESPEYQEIVFGKKSNAPPHDPVTGDADPEFDDLIPF